MNIFDLLFKDTETLREEHKKTMAYADEMTAAQMEFFDKLVRIADKYERTRKDTVFAAATTMIDIAFNNDFTDWEEQYKKEATK